jgi:hypothetical protein
MIRVVRISMIIRMRSGLSTSASSGPSPEGTSQAAPSRRAAGSSQGPSATASRHAPMSIFRAPPGAALAFRASAFRQGGIRHPRVGILRDPQQDPLETRLGRIGAAGDSLSCSLLQSNDPTRVPVAASTTTERPDSSHTRIVGPLFSSGPVFDSGAGIEDSISIDDSDAPCRIGDPLGSVCGDRAPARCDAGP